MLPDAQHERDRIVLVVTNERSRGRYLVKLDDKTLRLSHGQQQLLMELIKTRNNSRGRGYFADAAVAYPAAVCRLRKLIDEALGAGVGKEIIETGAGSEYRLAPFVHVIDEVENYSDKRAGGLGRSSSERLSAA